VSQSPTGPHDKKSVDRYRAAWQATMKLLREGGSLSGHERNCVFLNCQGPPFANVSAVTGLDFPDDGRGVALTDWDHDGDLDIWLSNRTGPRLRLMRNETISSTNKRPLTGNFVAFQLEGTASNRDAIGARVEVRLADQSAGKLVQTLYAGDAYLSQSSKWLHFGLGGKPQIAEVIVRWPHGSTEPFREIRPGRRYRLVEGSGKAVDVTKSRSALQLVPSTQPTLPPTLTARTFLSNRLPMPILRYRPFDESLPGEIETHHRPLLVCLWASWCAPCAVELKEVADHAEELRDVGLEIVALSVDGMDQEQSTKPEDARRLLEKIHFPFPAGVATREMLEKWEIAEQIVFNRQSPLAVPISFLLDADGALAVIYRGPIDVPLLREDVRRLDTPRQERRDLAVPLAGRWSSPPRELLLRAVARIFEQSGYTEDYTRYLAMETDFIKQQRERATSDAQRREWDERYAAAHFNLGVAMASAGQSQEAMEQFQRVVEIQPDHFEAHVNLGALLARDGQIETAARTLRRAVELAPDSVPARMNLGTALGSQGEFDQAIDEFRQVLAARPANAQAHAQLAVCLLETGELREAAEHFEQAIGLNPRDIRSQLALAWLRATCPVESIRDAAEAVRLAEQLEKLSGGNDARVLDVLAAALAEHGNYPRARQSCAQALEQLGPDEQELRSAILGRQQGYEAGKPHRDSDGKYP
jgi:tetratricopeptide (TPR) repeat protein/peroxiredoxin